MQLEPVPEDPSLLEINCSITIPSTLIRPVSLEMIRQGNTSKLKKAEQLSNRTKAPDCISSKKCQSSAVGANRLIVSHKPIKIQPALATVELTVCKTKLLQSLHTENPTAKSQNIDKKKKHWSRQSKTRSISYRLNQQYEIDKNKILRQQQPIRSRLSKHTISQIQIHHEKSTEGSRPKGATQSCQQNSFQTPSIAAGDPNIRKADRNRVKSQKSIHQTQSVVLHHKSLAKENESLVLSKASMKLSNVFTSSLKIHHNSTQEELDQNLVELANSQNSINYDQFVELLEKMHFIKQQACSLLEERKYIKGLWSIVTQSSKSPVPTSKIREVIIALTNNRHLESTQSIPCTMPLQPIDLNKKINKLDLVSKTLSKQKGPEELTKFQIQRIQSEFKQLYQNKIKFENSKIFLEKKTLLKQYLKNRSSHILPVASRQFRKRK